MIRDFTEGTEAAVEEAIRYALEESGQDEEMRMSVQLLEEECELDYEEIVENAEKLASQSRGYCDAQKVAEDRLHSVFENARNKDAECASKITDGTAASSEEYIASLRKLANCLNVKGLGSTREEFRYRKGYDHSTYETSIFGDPSAFAAKVAAAGNGVYGAFYDSINPDIEENRERLYEFLKRDPSTVEDWELDAMLTILDECVIEGEQPGEMTLDYEKISMILTGCYTEEAYSPLNGFTSYTNYYANDMLDYLAIEYDRYYQSRATDYSRMEQPLFAYADLNAILTSTSRYYGNVKTMYTDDYIDENGWPHEREFGIIVSEVPDETQRIRITTAQDDWEEGNVCLNPFDLDKDLFTEGKHDIYVLKAQENIDFNNSVINQKEGGMVTIQEAIVRKTWGDVGDSASKKADHYIDTVVTEGLSIGGPGPVAAYRQVRSYVDVVQETRENNERLEREIEFEKYRGYCAVLCMGGQTISCGDGDIMICNTKPDENELRIKVAYYNLEMGKDVTMEQVLDSYHAFTVGDEEGSALIESFRNSFYNGSNAEIGSENAFHYAVNTVLDKENGSVGTASGEQVEAAIQYVIAHPELVK